MVNKDIDPIRVLLVDDHRLVREGIRMVLGNGNCVDVVGEAENIDNALTLIAEMRPDIILLDLEVDKQSSLERLAEIKAASPRSRILFLTGRMDEKTNERALLGGAHGLVLKNSASGTLLMAVKKVHGGEVWFDRKLTSRMLSESGRRDRNTQMEQLKINSLTKRELEVAKLIAAGHVNKNIAKHLFISEKTVRNHLTTIYSKIGVINRLELAIFASKNGLTS
ncbi:response regulator transcription factor [soil metagenome]